MSKRSHSAGDEEDNPSFLDPSQGPEQSQSPERTEEPPHSPHTAKFHRIDPEMSDDATGATNGGGVGLNHGNHHQEQKSTAMICTLPGCKVKHFPNPEAYETHISKEHTNRCQECRKNFPSQRILECHIKENHDTLSQLKKERGEKIYECFVEECDKVCSAPAKRRRHLIDKHYYPPDFNCYVVNDGIDKMRSLLRSPPRKSRTRIRSPSDAAMDVDSGGGVPKSSTHQRKNSKLVKKKDAGKGESDAKDSHPTDDCSKSVNGGDNGPDTMEEDVVPQDKNEQDNIMRDLSSKMATVSMVPRSVKFGRKSAGFAKQ